MSHLRGETCPACDEKLATAHELLQAWYKRVKAAYPDVHVAWAYRDEESQNAAFLAGASMLLYPKSPHNKIPARALDLFQLNPFGKGVFDGIAMARINHEMGEGVQWGGEFRHLGDKDHFQLPEEA